MLPLVLVADSDDAIRRIAVEVASEACVIIAKHGEALTEAAWRHAPTVIVLGDSFPHGSRGAYAVSDVAAEGVAVVLLLDRWVDGDAVQAFADGAFAVIERGDDDLFRRVLVRAITRPVVSPVAA